jgi:NSS family neurotransmitter:Na+ symporter
MNNQRETFSNQLGFIIVSVACAIGLGNIWLMPYRAGTYGGALYIFLVALFIFIFAIPVLLTEYAVGRGSGQSTSKAFHVLTPKTKWVANGYLGIAGNFVLLMFYVMIVGFCFAYLGKGITGSLVGQSPEYITASWGNLTGNAGMSFFLMVLTVALGMGITFLGLRKGIERFGKIMMGIFLVLIVILLFRSITLPGAGEGLRFLFVPNLDAMREHGTVRIIHMAIGQSLFSLSVGIGCMAIFGSYIGKQQRLFKGAFVVGALDLIVIMLALLMIFPAAFAFGIPATAGEGLLFVTLPNIFNQMAGAYVWSLMFYVGLAFVAFSTAAAVMENLVAIGMDKFGWTRGKSSLVNFVLLVIACTPSAFTRNIWRVSEPILGQFPHLGAFFTFLAMEVILPIGALLYVLYCTSKRGWGWDNFIKEANTGEKGWIFPVSLRFYMTYVMPVIIIIVFVFGQLQRWVLVPRGIIF